MQIDNNWTSPDKGGCRAPDNGEARGNAAREIDNSSTIFAHTIERGFGRPGNFFVVHLMQRKKDGNPRDRFVFTKFVYSPEYWLSRIEEWKRTARENNARLYVNPNMRNNEVVLRQMAKDCIDLLATPEKNLNDFVRSSVSKCHQTPSDDKRWIIDLDRDDAGIPFRAFGSDHNWAKYVGSAFDYVSRMNSGAEQYIVETPNGAHIVTRPFDIRCVYDRSPSCKDKPPFGADKIKKDDLTLVFFAPRTSISEEP